MHPLMVLLIVIGALFGVHYIRRAPKAQQPKLILIGVGLLLVILAMSGKLSPLVAALGAAVAAGTRVMGLLGTLKGLGGFAHSAGAGSRDGGGSRLATEWLVVNIDADSGRMSGKVLKGRKQGMALGSLGEAQLTALHGEFCGADHDTACLLETWLESEYGSTWASRLGVTAVGGGRRQSHHGRGARPPTTGMSVAEARSVLGVGTDADKDTVVTAHRRLMQKLHPDRGGTDFLAAKVNEAKRTLLKAS